MRQTRGTFRGRTVAAAFVIRFDLDGADIGGQPVVSGDVYDDNFDLESYVASFFSDQVEVDDRQLTARLVFSRHGLIGSLRCERQDAGDRIHAKLHMRASNGRAAETYDFVLEDEHEHFRELQVEVDLVSGTEAPLEYELDDLRVTVESSFRQAGIKILPGNERTILDPSAANGDNRWSPSELNAAMNDHFSGFRRNQVTWRVYLLIATRYLNDTTTGIMFDTFGRHHRQGVAVFHTTRKSTSHRRNFQRDYIRTVTHELGHALNLLHSFDSRKKFGQKRRARSFMNYPQEYTGGSAAYWGSFKFRFEPEEVLFMRHGPLFDVIPGGSVFSAGGHDSMDAADELSTPKTVDGLKLEIRVRIPAKVAGTANVAPDFLVNHFLFGEPVHVEAKLSNLSGEEREVEDALDPCHEQTTFLIQKPNGQTVSHKPIMRRCGEPRTVVLHLERRPSIYEDIDLNYGTDGFQFIEPGRYRVQCVMRVGERSLISNVLRVWVGYPSREEEKRVAPLFDDRIGAYLSLWGSESPYLDGAKGLLDDLENSKPFQGHPLVDWHRLCRATCSVHGFKTIASNGQIEQLRKPADDLKPLRDAIGLNAQYNPNRQTNLSNIVVGHLWGQLVKIVGKDGSEDRVQKRLQSAVKQMKGFDAKDWMLASLMSRWGLEEMADKTLT